MSELSLTPFPAPAGLATLGADDAGVCLDGVCVVPQDLPGPPRAETAVAEDAADR